MCLEVLPIRLNMIDPLCPDEQPEFGASCSPEGLNCSYGSEECCGTTSPEIKIECGSEGLWKGYFVDTICHFGRCIS